MQELAPRAAAAPHDRFRRAGDFRVAEKRRLHQHSAIAPFAFTGRRIHQRKNRREISAPPEAGSYLLDQLELVHDQGYKGTAITSM